MGTIAAIIILGGGFGYIMAIRRKGNYLDKLQYVAVFSIISLLAAVIIQIVLMNLILF